MAGNCSFTVACTFFAISDSSLLVSLRHSERSEESLFDPTTRKREIPRRKACLGMTGLLVFPQVESASPMLSTRRHPW